MEKSKNFSNESEKEVYIKKKLLGIHVRRSFFCVFIFFIFCGSILILSSSKVYKKQREVTEIKYKISKATEELESLELELLNLKGFDKVMEYAEYLNMRPLKLGDSIFVNLSVDNFNSDEQEQPEKPFILKIYDKIFGKN